MRRGMSKRESVAMPPAAMREVEMLRVWMRVVVVDDILMGEVAGRLLEFLIFEIVSWIFFPLLSFSL